MIIIINTITNLTKIWQHKTRYFQLEITKCGICGARDETVTDILS